MYNINIQGDSTHLIPFYLFNKMYVYSKKINIIIKYSKQFNKRFKNILKNELL